MPYATGTNVPADRSRAEIEKMMIRFGADQFVSGWSGTERAMVGFRIHNRMVRIYLPMPDRKDPMIALTPSGRERSDGQVEEEYDRETRRRWRSLVLVIKAKLSAIEDGISTVEREFLADVVLPNGSTMGEWAGPQISEMYEGGRMPELLPGSRRK